MSEIIKSVLDWNPWFDVWKVPEELLWKKRNIDLKQYLEFKEIKILNWARRTGKSTLVYTVISEVIKNNKNIVYLNFDDEVLINHSLEEIMEEVLVKKDIDYIFLDEIQNCKKWARYIRKAYDTRKFKQIWITWSNSSLMQKEYSNILTWRIISLKINSLNFREYLEFNWEKNIDLDLLSSDKEIQIRKNLENYLQLWWFPELSLRKFNKKELLINYFNDFIYKDIVWRYNVNSEKVKKLAYYLLSNTSKLFSYRKLAQTLDLNVESLYDYLNYFYEIYFFEELKRFDYSYKKQLVSPKKIYSLDTGFISLGFNFSENIWRKLENLVFIELKRRGLEVYYHREKKECDFVIDNWWKIVKAIQVSYSLVDEDTKKRELEWLIDAMESYSLEEGLIISYDEEYEIPHFEYRIKVIPVWKWLLWENKN